MTLGPVRGSEMVTPLHLPFPPPLSAPPHPPLFSNRGPWGLRRRPRALGVAVSLPELQAALPPSTLQGSGASRSSPCRAWVLLFCPWGVDSCGHPVGRLRTEPQLEEAGRSLQGPLLRLPRGHTQVWPQVQTPLSAGAASSPASGAVAQQTGAQVTSSEAAPGS